MLVSYAEWINVRAWARQNDTAQADYKNKRLNGDEKVDSPDYKLPEDGKITWVKGEVKGDYVYGVKNKDGYYEYEVRYDEGPGDKKWMEECDRNYLARLYILGANTSQEQQDLAENRERAARAAEEIAKLPKNQLSHALKIGRAQKNAEQKAIAEKERRARDAKAAEAHKQQELAEFKAAKEKHDQRIASQRSKKHKALDAKLEARLDKYRCSITALVMLDPVIAADGITYEREAIESWLEKHDTSPKTNVPLANKTLTPNVMAREFIQELLENHPELWDSGEVYESIALEAKFDRAIRNSQLGDLKTALSADKRLVKIPLEDQKSLISVALEQKSTEMTSLAISRLGKDIHNIPELEVEDGAKLLFRKAAQQLGAAGAKLVGDALGMQAAEYQDELWNGIKNRDVKLARIDSNYRLPIR